MKEDQSRQRHNGTGAKAPRQVGETAGRLVCLEHSEGEGEGEREADHVGVPRPTQVLHRADIMAGGGGPSGRGLQFTGLSCAGSCPVGLGTGQG